MIRNYSVLGSGVAAALFILLAQVAAAGELPRRAAGADAPHAFSGTAAPGPGQLSQSFDIKGAQHAVVSFTVDVPGKITVIIQAKGDPVNGSLLKPGGTPVSLTGSSTLEYMASADDVKKGNEWKVEVFLAAPKSARRNAALNSDGHASGDITIQRPAGKGNGQQSIHEIPENPNAGSARSAAVHVADQPLRQAPAVVSQQLMAKRNGETAPAPVGNANQQQSQPGAPAPGQPQYQQYQPGPQDPGQSQYQPGTQGSGQSQYQQYQPGPQDTGQPQYQPGTQGSGQPQYQPGTQGSGQPQYQQQYQQSDSTAVQSPLQQQSPQFQQPSYQGQSQYQGQQYQGQQYQGQQYQGQQYQGQPQYQAQQPGMPQQNQVQPGYAPSAALPGGTCAVKLSVDRSTINLVDPNTGSERKHLSLGQDRVQKVFSAPDNTWSVAVYKIRGAQQYGFIALDLAKCEDQLPSDLSAIPSEARFEQTEVVLTIDSKEKRFPLRNSRMQ